VTIVVGTKIVVGFGLVVNVVGTNFVVVVNVVGTNGVVE
jgi:hypothetical protein